MNKSPWLKTDETLRDGDRTREREFRVKTNELRSLFLEYFREKGHLLIPSSSLVPYRDPSVLLTTAGMQQFKPYFLGLEEAPQPRLTSVQKCFRTTDIDLVGMTARHCTFFEMLGNFSVGDYFKDGAIRFAYEFSTEHMGLDEDRIWVTAFEGDAQVGPDEESMAHWEEVGVPRERMVKLPRSENFWGPPGPSGPCGPCSELYYDRGPEHGCGRPDCAPGCDCDRYFEYWNLVFMEYNMSDQGELTTLPAKSIDTGMGLERIAVLKQDVDSIFLADSFKPLIELGEEISGTRFGENENVDVALRVLADHSRALAFLTADGVNPGNEGRGYVLRRIIRRAIRLGRRADMQPPFLRMFVERVIEMYGDTYPELVEKKEAILRTADGEEERFNRTLDQGVVLLEEEVARAKTAEQKVFPGTVAFTLHDTYGFPVEVTREMVEEEGLELDEEGFETSMKSQREMARASSKGSNDGDARMITEFARKVKAATEFKGHEEDEVHTVVEAVERLEGSKVVLALRESPFYAEAGGQSADLGWIESGDGRAEVRDVQQEGAAQVIVAELISGELKEGSRVKAAISTVRRHALAANHTATHLLHYALRALYGEDAVQSGSSVRADKFRFDFSYDQPLTRPEITEIEEIVNKKIIENHPVRAFTTNLDHARDLGATALFGEKYGDFVRVVEVDDFSRELCGGTHVGTTSEIGVFKILSSTSVGANVRRIEAITGDKAVRYFRDRDNLVTNLAHELGGQEDQLLQTAKNLHDVMAALEQEAEELRAGRAEDDVGELVEQAEWVAATRVAVGVVAARDMDHLVSLVDRVRDKVQPAVVALGSVVDGKALMAAGVSKEVRAVAAGDLVGAGAEVMGGGGGGNRTLGRAGGGSPGSLEDALEKVRVDVIAALGG